MTATTGTGKQEAGNKLAEIRAALAALETLNLHFDETWDDEGTISDGLWIGENFIIPDSEVTSDQLEAIGRSRDYLRTLLAVAEAAAEIEDILNAGAIEYFPDKASSKSFDKFLVSLAKLTKEN